MTWWKWPVIKQHEAEIRSCKCNFGRQVRGQWTRGCQCRTGAGWSAKRPVTLLFADLLLQNCTTAAWFGTSNSSLSQTGPFFTFLYDFMTKRRRRGETWGQLQLAEMLISLVLIDSVVVGASRWKASCFHSVFSVCCGTQNAVWWPHWRPWRPNRKKAKRCRCTTNPIWMCAMDISRHRTLWTSSKKP